MYLEQKQFLYLKMTKEMTEKLLKARIELTELFDKKYKSRLEGWSEVQKRAGLHNFKIKALIVKWNSFYRKYKDLLKETTYKKITLYTARKWKWFDLFHAFHNRSISIPQPDTPNIADTSIKLSPTPLSVLSVSPNPDNQPSIHLPLSCNEICRTCSSNLEADQKISIFAGEIYYIDRNIQIMEIFKSCIKVKIKEDNLLPQNICLTCLSQLMACYAFTLKCVKAEKSYKKSTKANEIYIIENSFSQNKLDDLESNIEIKDQFHYSNLENDKLNSKHQNEFLISKIPDQVNNELSSKINLKVQTENFDIFQIRDICADTQFTTNNSNQEKENNLSKINETERSLSMKQDVKNISDNLTSDLEIEVPFHNSNLENDKLYSKIEKEFLESLIPDQVNNELSLKINLKEQNENVDVFEIRDICTDTQFITNNSNQEKENKLSKIHETKRSLRKADLIEKLKYHMKARSNLLEQRKLLQCRKNNCNKSFFTVVSYRKHLATHFSRKEHLCEFCGNSFKNIETLTQHLSSHESDDKICNLCNMKFLEKLSYQKHLRRHSERPFKCDDCSAAYRDKRSLQQHAVVHTTERPYKCPKCEASYKLNTHVVHHYNKDHTYVKILSPNTF